MAHLTMALGTIAVAALLVTACGGESSTSTSTPSTLPDPAAATTTMPSTSAGVSGEGVDACSRPAPVDRFTVEDVAELPDLDAMDATTAVGDDGAAASRATLVASLESVCDLPVSPGVQEAIDQVRAAAAAGDQAEVRRLLEDLIRGSAIQALATPIKTLRNAFGFEADRQKVRDATAAAGEAQAQGEGDLADEAYSAAQKHFKDYADKAIPATSDPEVLMGIAKDAQVLGLDDVWSEAWEKAKRIYEEQLAAIIARFDPCTAGPEEAGELNDATANVMLTGGDGTDGALLLWKWVEIQHKRALGEPVPECEQWSLAMTMDVDTGQGLVTFLWDGVFTASDGTLEGSGVGTVLGNAECYENGTTIEVSDVTGAFVFDVGGSHVVSGDGQQLELMVVSRDIDVTVAAQDERCVGLAEIGEGFLELLPTFPPQFYPEGFTVELSNGVGSADIALDLYTLHVNVAVPG